MIFIIESGSTKSDWVLVDNKNNQSFYTTIGFNPYFHSSEFIEKEILKSQAIAEVSGEISKIYFFGAGCSSAELNEIIYDGLRKVFQNAEVHVDHDLVACAYATYKGSAGISCIIGTGSNSCYFDGENLVEEVPALGYILGDEGSGSYFGKYLLSNYLYHKLPEDINSKFVERYGLSKDEIIDFVYKKPNANVYISSFMPFVVEHKDHSFFKEVIVKGLENFMEVHVCCYANYKETPVHFVGSLSAILEKELREAANKYGIVIESIVKNPIDGLVKYHLKYVIKNEVV